MTHVVAAIASHTWVQILLGVVLVLGLIKHFGIKDLSIFLFGFVLPLGLIVGSAFLLQKPRTFDPRSKRCDAVMKTLSSVVDFGASENSIKSSRVSAKVAKGDTRGLEGYWSNECVAYSAFSDKDLSVVVNVGDFGTHSFAAGEVWQGGQKLEIPSGAPGTPRLLAAWKSGTAVVINYQFATGRLWASIQVTFAYPTSYSLDQGTAKTVQIASDFYRHMPTTRDLDVDRQFRDHLAWVWAAWIVLLALVPVLLAPFIAGRAITKWKLLVVLVGVAKLVGREKSGPLPGLSLVRSMRVARLARSGSAFLVTILWGAATLALVWVLPSQFSLLATAAVIAAIFLPVEVLRTALLGATRQYRYLRPNSAAEWQRVLVLALIDSVFVGGVMYVAARLAVAWMMVPLAADNNGGSWAALIWAVFLGPVVFLIMSFLLQLARPLRRRSAEQVMQRDQRKQLLYLRSFRDDRVSMPTHFSLFNPLSYVFDWNRVEPYEEFLARALWRNGPVLAVGRPGERRAPLGAARVYYPDEAWQSAVTNLIQSSELLVVTMGRTAGLSWELAQLKSLGALGKAIVLVPPTAGDLTRVAVLAKELDVEDVWSGDEGALVPSAFWFDLQSRPQALYADVLDDTAYEVSIGYAIRRIRGERETLERMLQDG
ncbi:hypothetical protein SAMN05892883_2826 [Jatrophihabitans sp. GAS493]|uniref:hypothetical protein n=1 Tax=Jatrophihabitans sp. GAS493 TaxID=1907575 RepID=UPI000BC0C380|nr:hypothetical protein [Jatrophihabitans sp. GAS493]SOD73535.1 hypothetical protein SAMN05892883_2826 [Jatrophihabitans sp. GAS493]